MPVTAQSILARVRRQLIDEADQVRWEDGELLSWLSDGQRTLVAMDPSLGDVTGPVALVVGSKQTLPDGAFMLLDITCNMGRDGAEPGRVVTVISRENLDRIDPNWRSGLRSEITQHYIYDPKTPRTYYVYPPSNGDNWIEISRAHNPPDITTLADLITVPDLYQTALFDYVMFRAHQKDSDYAAGEGKAGVYLQLFQMFLTGHTQGQTTDSPNRQLGPMDLADKGAAA